LKEEQKKSHIEDSGENGIEKVPWKEQFSQFYVMSQDANLDFADQDIVTANLLFLH